MIANETTEYDARPLPDLRQTEMAMLSCMLQDESARALASAKLEPDDFFDPVHRQAFTEVSRLRGSMPNIIDAAKGGEQSPHVAALLSCWSNTADLSHFDFYCQCLRESRIARDAFDAASAVRTLILAGEPVAGTLGAFAWHSQRLHSINKLDGRQDKSVKAITLTIINELEATMRNTAPTHPQTPWQCWNRTFGGITPNLLAIGGPPGGGKSVLALNLTRCLLESGKRVLFISYEMADRDIIKRLLCDMGNIRGSVVFNPQQFPPNAGEMNAIARTFQEIGKLPLVINSAYPSIPEVVAQAKRMAGEKEGLGAVVIDYLQLAPDPNPPKNDSRERRIAIMSAATKQMKEELQIPVIILSQLNDDGKMRESRSITQDAESVCVINDDGIFVAKNRNGVMGDLLPLKLTGAFFRFTEANQ